MGARERNQQNLVHGARLTLPQGPTEAPRFAEGKRILRILMRQSMTNKTRCPGRPQTETAGFIAQA